MGLRGKHTSITGPELTMLVTCVRTAMFEFRETAKMFRDAAQHHSLERAHKLVQRTHKARKGTTTTKYVPLINSAGANGLAEQFEYQAKVAEQLYDLLECATAVHVPVDDDE